MKPDPFVRKATEERPKLLMQDPRVQEAIALREWLFSAAGEAIDEYNHQRQLPAPPPATTRRVVRANDRRSHPPAPGTMTHMILQQLRTAGSTDCVTAHRNAQAVFPHVTANTVANVLVSLMERGFVRRVSRGIYAATDLESVSNPLSTQE